MDYDPKYNILIVDDEEEVSSIIKKYLSIYPRFKNIVIASDGVQAIQKLQNQEFDLIITDLILPKRDGMTLIDDIRKIPQFSKTKIMVVSGFLSKDFVILALKKGVRQIVVKPFNALQILEKAFEALSIHEQPKKFAKDVIRLVADETQEKKMIDSAREDMKKVLKEKSPESSED